MSESFTYVLWFNLARKNSYKEDKSPLEIIPVRDPTLPMEIVNLAPVFLDELLVQHLDKKREGVPSYSAFLFCNNHKFLNHGWGNFFNKKFGLEKGFLARIMVWFFDFYQ